MSPRQARRERREAERKARKAEIKRMKAARSILPPEHAEAAPLSEPRPRKAGEAVLLAASSPEFSEATVAGFVSQNRTPTVREGLGFVSQSSQARREINRANAQHSTGPRSITGKLASSRNSLQHGLASGTLIVPGEDPAAFEQLTTGLLEEHQPASETETLLVHEMARSWWLTQRAIRLQNECFTDDGGIDEKRMALLLRYQTTHERALYKALDTLLKLKRSRDRQGAVSAIAKRSGFVPQNNPNPAPEIGFVSQNPGSGTPIPASAQAEAA